MFRNMITVLLLVLVAGSRAPAVDTLQVTSRDPVLDSWRWTTFDRTSGLAGAVNEVFEDRAGNIWFATDRGVRPDTAYEVLETQLQSGDYVVFCSDGIAEADNPSGEQFSYERTEETICKVCQEGLSAEGTIDQLLEEVDAFRGDTPQGDDMTCVVLRVV